MRITFFYNLTHLIAMIYLNAINKRKKCIGYFVIISLSLSHWTARTFCIFHL